MTVPMRVTSAGDGYEYLLNPRRLSGSHRST